MTDRLPPALGSAFGMALNLVRTSIRHPLAPFAALLRRKDHFASAPWVLRAPLGPRVVTIVERNVRRRYDAVRKAQPVAVGFDGTHICIDPDDRNLGVTFDLLMIGILEPEIVTAFLRTVQPGMTVLDVGANLGWYTLLASSRIGGAGRVVAVEPEEHNFRLLSESVALNRCANVTLVQACLDARAGERLLFVSAENAGGHSITHRTAGTLVQRVSAESLDGLVARLAVEHVDLIKIDAESAEPLIVAGGTSVLFGERPPIVIMEFSPAAWRGFEGLLTKLETEFLIYRFTSLRKGWERVATIDTVHARQVNLYLVPRAGASDWNRDSERTPGRHFR